MHIVIEHSVECAVRFSPVRSGKSEWAENVNEQPYELEHSRKDILERDDIVFYVPASRAPWQCENTASRSGSGRLRLVVGG